MKNLFHLLQINWIFQDYKFAVLGFLTAFSVTLIIIPPAIALFKKLGLLDIPEARKVHTMPVPTMGGITIIAGMTIGLLFWFPFSNNPEQICFFFSLIVLTALGIIDDLRDLAARYKLLVQAALAMLVAASGIRVTKFEGPFG